MFFYGIHFNKILEKRNLNNQKNFSSIAIKECLNKNKQKFLYGGPLAYYQYQS